MIRIKRRQEGLLVHQLSSSGVHHAGSWLHTRQEISVNHQSRLGEQRNVQQNKIRALGKLLNIYQLDIQ
jgi:hypothetical protein